MCARITCSPWAPPLSKGCGSRAVLVHARLVTFGLCKRLLMCVWLVLSCMYLNLYMCCVCSISQSLTGNMNYWVISSVRPYVRKTFPTFMVLPPFMTSRNLVNGSSLPSLYPILALRLPAFSALSVTEHVLWIYASSPAHPWWKRGHTAMPFYGTTEEGSF